MAMLMLLANVVSSSGQTVEMPALKDAFKDSFLIGAALGREVANGQDEATRQRVARQFNTVTSTNMLKWGPFNPKPGEFNHELADHYVAFGREHAMYVVGHVLFWHNQTPQWVFENEAGEPLTREALLERMRQRVRHLARRYGSKIDAWDVVNESILDNGTLRDSEWTKIIGDDFIEQAFRIADEELPKSVALIYNDYSMPGDRKRDAVVKMVRDLKAKGVRIDGVGMQGHWSLGGPSVKAIEEAIEAFAATGVAVHITELDIDVLPRKAGMWGGADIRRKLEQDPAMDPYRDGLPHEIQQKLAERYAELFALFLRHRDKIKRVTFWGTTDRYSWLNHWPIKGRTNHPLLFDRQGKPKPAFDAVMKVASQAGTPRDEGYRLVWADEFETAGPPNPKNWTFEHGFVRNQELQWYQPDNAFCKDGRLIIEGRRERKPNPNYKDGSGSWKTNRQFIEYTSACVKTRGLHSWQYGRFEVKARIKTEAGLWPAIWFLGVEGEWPNNGEIDLMEFYQSKILANAAWGTKTRWSARWDSSKTPITSFQDPQWDEKFHIWRMDWDEKQIKLYIDDKLLNTIDVTKTINPTDRGPRNPFGQPHYLLLNLAIGGTAGGDPSKTEFPTQYEIEYVRVYQKGQ